MCTANYPKILNLRQAESSLFYPFCFRAKPPLFLKLYSQVISKKLAKHASVPMECHTSKGSYVLINNLNGGCCVSISVSSVFGLHFELPWRRFHIFIRNKTCIRRKTLVLTAYKLHSVFLILLKASEHKNLLMVYQRYH